MPHDRKGQELRPGDVVLVRCRVKAVHLVETACNVDLAIDGGRIVGDVGKAHYSGYLPEFTCNSSLTEQQP